MDCFMALAQYHIYQRKSREKAPAREYIRGLEGLKIRRVLPYGSMQMSFLPKKFSLLFGPCIRIYVYSYFCVNQQLMTSSLTLQQSQVITIQSTHQLLMLFMLIPSSVIVLVLSLLPGTLSQININQTMISSTRNPNRDSLCLGSFNVSTDDKSTGESLMTSYKSQFGNSKLISRIIENNLTTTFVTSEDLSPIVIFAVPHCVCLVVLVLLWPALCCCCTCPELHPACDCCRKKHKEMYTRFELKWTSYILILVTLLCIGGAVSGLVKGPDVISHYNNTACKMVTIIDDTIYGRVSDDGQSFFIGLSPLSTALDLFNSKINTFYTQSSNCFSTANTIKPDGTTVLTQNTNLYSSYNDITYSNAFTSSDGVTYVDVVSQFKNMYLGPTTDATKVTGIMNSQLGTFFTVVNDALDPMLTAWSYLSTTKTQADVTATLTAAAAAIRTQVGVFNGNIDSLAGQFGQTNTLDKARMGLAALYGLILSLSILMLLCAVMLACCSVVRLRLIIYPVCALLVILGVISFIILIAISIILPINYLTCSYLDLQISSPTNAQNFFSNLGFPDIGSQLSPCFNGDYNLITKINTDLSSALDNIVTISTNTQNFPTLTSLYSTNNLKATFVQARDIIMSVYNASKLDLNDTVSSSFFTAIATKGYVVDGTCNTTTVNGDCWVPSYTTGTCRSGIGRMPPCSNLGNTVTCPLGCYEIQNTFVNPSGDSGYLTNLATRYTAGCKYIGLIDNVHNNYNVQRMNTMLTTNSSVNTIQTNALNYDTKVSTLKSNLGTFSVNLNANFDQTTNTKTGAFYGRGCKPIQESVTSFRDSLCTGMFGYLHYNMVCLAICSWAILFMACCATCAGVRHYNHIKKIELAMGQAGIPVNLSETKIMVGDTNELR